ncbi:MAG: hypothetical protein M1827_004384 [Pycnora praestabilis]|nr:MAG: hypothetical protein M1827_004384 [Pycnora praestabilis]
MNWTGGRLTRHSRNGGSASINLQKQHFARARTKLQNGSHQSSPLKWSPFEKLEAEPLQGMVHYQDNASSEWRNKSPKRQKTLSEYSSTAPLAERLNTLLPRQSAAYRQQQRGRVDTEQVLYHASQQPQKTTFTSQQLNPGAASYPLEQERKRLLCQPDWVGLAIARPAKLRFPASNDREKIGKRRKTTSDDRARRNAPAQPSYNPFGERILVQQPTDTVSTLFKEQNISIRIGEQHHGSQGSSHWSGIRESSADLRARMSSEAMLLDLEEERVGAVGCSPTQGYTDEPLSRELPQQILNYEEVANRQVQKGAHNFSDDLYNLEEGFILENDGEQVEPEPFRREGGVSADSGHDEFEDRQESLIETLVITPQKSHANEQEHLFAKRVGLKSEGNAKPGKPLDPAEVMVPLESKQARDGSKNRSVRLMFRSSSPGLTLEVALSNDKSTTATTASPQALSMMVETGTDDGQDSTRGVTLDDAMWKTWLDNKTSGAVGVESTKPTRLAKASIDQPLEDELWMKFVFGDGENDTNEESYEYNRASEADGPALSIMALPSSASCMMLDHGAMTATEVHTSSRDGASGPPLVNRYPSSAAATIGSISKQQLKSPSISSPSSLLTARASSNTTQSSSGNLPTISRFQSSSPDPLSSSNPAVQGKLGTRKTHNAGSSSGKPLVVLTRPKPFIGRQVKPEKFPKNKAFRVGPKGPSWKKIGNTLTSIYDLPDDEATDTERIEDD